MKNYYYDLHIHSCLSPCGDSDNTPNNIAGMASLCGLDIVALTDHNSCKNCPSFFKVAEKYSIIPIAGMELTTSEDIHVVCLFEHLEDAMRFDDFVQANRKSIKNKPEIFGEQTVLNDKDEIVACVDELLISASFISIEDVHNIVSEFNGICYPAHIDRDANGVIAILGTLPDYGFDFYEIHDGSRIDEFSDRYSIPKNRFIVSSDSHYLTDMRDKEFSFSINEDDPSAVRKHLFEYLRGN